MDDNLRVCIFGASGFVGRRIVREILRRHPKAEILALSRLNKVPVASNITWHSADLLKDDWTDIRDKIVSFKPKWIVMMAALTLYNPPETEWDNYFMMNSKIPALVANLKNCNQLPDDAQILWASTDMVFDGDHAPYSSSSERSPLTIYGISKKSGEDALLGSALVVRFPQLYGLGGTFFQNIYDNLLKNDAKLNNGETIEKIKLFGDEWRSVALGSDVARIAVDFLEHATNEDCNKVWNFGGPSRVSRFELGAALAERLGFRKESMLEEVATASIIKDVKRPADLTMDSTETYEKLSSWGCALPLSLSEGVKKAVDEGPV
eukprot:TRINITY_DN3218_c0_g1_i1.p2 TRINITY_DN3218_c0_g1~~TRINITY_DN3218_c0_g1_i1.p2  ORF type:complete len:321 (-),score=40.35 TRINITY_DN3218_c0_g1_i1:2565-3527(-)